MIVMSYQDFKLHGKQISPTFSYFPINNTQLYHFLANLLVHNKEMTEKSVFWEAWSPEMMSQSFPVSCFWSHSFVSHQKWNFTFLVHQNMGKKNRYWIYLFLLYLSVHCGDFIEQIKKICHIHFKGESKWILVVVVKIIMLLIMQVTFFVPKSCWIFNEFEQKFVISIKVGSFWLDKQ